MSNKKHVLLLSHQRSGTHLTIDLIRNNFSNLASPYVSIKEIYIRRSSEYDRDILSRMERNSLVFKLHSTSNYTEEYLDYPFLSELITHLLNEANIIYVHRDPKDTLVSLYFHYLSMFPQLKKQSIDDFIFAKFYSNCKLNRLEYWIAHVQGWLTSQYGSKIFCLAFEDIINDYESVISDLSNYLQFNAPKLLKDVRTKSMDPNKLNRKIKGDNDITYTAVNFRNGCIGDHKNHLTIDAASQIDTLTGFYRYQLGVMAST